MENKEGQGVLFVNTQKKSEKSPDYSGTIKINGEDVKISGWKKTSNSGVNYISLSVNKKPVEKQESVAPDFEDDFNPF